MSDLWLNGLSDILNAQAEGSRAKEKELNDKLGAADLVMDDQEYWRVNGGVVRYVRYPNGMVNPHSRIEYPTALIEALHKLIAVTQERVR